MDVVEDGERARRDPDAEVGETWDSESLKGLERRRRKQPSVRVWRWGRVSDSCGGTEEMGRHRRGQPRRLVSIRHAARSIQHPASSTTHLIRLPFSSVFSRDGAARRDPWETDREALVPDALVGVGGSGFTVMLERALSVLEPVMELKREPSFLPIVTRRS